MSIVMIIETIAFFIAVILLIYAYLVAKREKLNLTFLNEDQISRIVLKKEIARDISVPIIVEATTLVAFGLFFEKYKLITIIILAIITLCVVAMENKIMRSLHRYGKQRGKKLKK
ncbi:MAG: hypothetical protein ACRDD2_03485 [Sarcina sp.]